MSNLKKQDGFNLLELMVVLLVAGILMTVGVPAFTALVVLLLLVLALLRLFRRKATAPVRSG